MRYKFMNLRWYNADDKYVYSKSNGVTIGWTITYLQSVLLKKFSLCVSTIHKKSKINKSQIVKTCGK